MNSSKFEIHNNWSLNFINNLIIKIVWWNRLFFHNLKFDLLNFFNKISLTVYLKCLLVSDATIINLHFWQKSLNWYLIIFQSIMLCQYFCALYNTFFTLHESFSHSPPSLQWPPGVYGFLGVLQDYSNLLKFFVAGIPLLNFLVLEPMYSGALFNDIVFAPLANHRTIHTYLP